MSRSFIDCDSYQDHDQCSWRDPRQFLPTTGWFLPKPHSATDVSTCIGYGRGSKLKMALPQFMFLLLTVSKCQSYFTSVPPIASTHVTFEDRPPIVKNITCIYHNRMRLTCTWDLGEHSQYLDLIEVSAKWKPDERYNEWWPCYFTNKTSCIFKSYTYSSFMLRVNVTSKFSNMSASQIFSTNETFNYDKPDPVSDLKPVSINSTCVSLSWSHGLSHLNFTITYDLQDSQSSRQNVISTKNSNVTVCNLQPFRNYKVEVVARSYINTEPFGFDSDPVTREYQSPEDVPSSGPRVSEGGYSRTLCTYSQQDVFIYFQPVNQDDMNGVITNYSANVTVVGKKLTEYTIENDTFTLKVNVTCNESVTAVFYASTSVGSSPGVLLDIPVDNNELQDMVTEMDLMIRITEPDSKTFQASWKPPTDNHLYKLYLYYCTESSPPKYCRGPMRIEQVNISEGSITTGDNMTASLFGLSLVAGNATSGIRFTECVYIPGGGEPEEFPDVQVEQIKRSARIKWTYPRCNRDKKFVTLGYRITVCEGFMNKCASYDADSASHSYHLANLKRGTKYTVKVEANTTSHSVESKVTTFTLEEEDIKKVIITALTVVLLVAVAAFALVCIIRHRYRQRSLTFVDLHYPRYQHKTKLNASDNNDCLPNGSIVLSSAKSGNKSSWRSFRTSVPKRQSCSLQKKTVTLTTPASEISHLTDYIVVTVKHHNQTSSCSSQNVLPASNEEDTGTSFQANPPACLHPGYVTTSI